MPKILIVEDESIIARDICRVLEKIEDISLSLADTYNAALSVIDNVIPDLVLLDIKLYDDADAGLRIARYLNDKYRIPFLFLSGYATDTYIQKAKKEMPVTFITKPVDSKQLEVAVLMAINENNYSKFRKIIIEGRRIDNVSEFQITKTVINNAIISAEKINPDEIQLIKTFNHIKRNSLLVKLYPKGFIITINTISNFMKMLPSNFVKVHSSFIVNKDFINGLIGSTSVKVGEEIVSFGTEFKKKKKFGFI